MQLFYNILFFWLEHYFSHFWRFFHPSCIQNLAIHLTCFLGLGYCSSVWYGFHKTYNGFSLPVFIYVTLSRTLSYIHGRNLIWTHVEDLIGRTHECLIWLQEMHKGQLGHRDKEKFRLEGYLNQEHWHVDLELTTADRLPASVMHGKWLPTALNSHIPWFSPPCYHWFQFC